MRFSLISLAAFSVAVIALIGADRYRDIDFDEVTGSLVPEEPQSDAARAGDAVRSSRLTAQLVVPSQGAEPRSGRPAPVMDDSQSEDTDDFGATDEVAQAAPQVSAPAVPTAASAAAPQVDESALRYFAARGDTARLQAEISRLRTLYPNWTPPADPLAVRPTTDPQLEAMWELYAQARYADVRGAIADRQTREPTWQPPADLMERLKLAEARMQLTGASDAKRYDDVIRIAAENPSLLTCSEVDVLWRLADAFAGTERQPRARDAYLYILDNCDAPSERLATVQKASELLPPEMLEDLLARERTPPGGEPEFETLRDDLARRLVADGDTDAKLVVAEKYLTRLERLAEREDMASDALLLGWYYYRRDNLGAAERWFRRANSREETASSAEGLALTLTRQNSPVEAENVLYRWRDSSPGTMAAYLAAVANLLALDPLPIIQDMVLARMAPVVVAGRDAAAAQQFGWYARAMQQPRTAAEWFASALSWKPDDEPSAYGLVLSRNDLGDRAGVAAIQRAWAGRSERIANLGEEYDRRTRPQQMVNQRAVDDGARVVRRAPVEQLQSVEPEPARQPVRVARAAPARSSTRGCAETIDPAGMAPQQALTRGWCLMDLNRPLEAARAFEVAATGTSQTVRSDAAYGRSLAYLRVGLIDKAAVAASDAPQNNTRAVELQSAILSERAVTAFKAGRYREALIALDQRAQIVPEQTDLMNMRGYAYLNVGRRPDALRIFEALANIGDPDGQRAYADLTAIGH
jgi:cellulose synthase operon protein C